MYVCDGEFCEKFESPDSADFEPDTDFISDNEIKIENKICDFKDHFDAIRFTGMDDRSKYLPLSTYGRQL